jgi:serine protease Do
MDTLRPIPNDDAAGAPAARDNSADPLSLTEQAAFVQRVRQLTPVEPAANDSRVAPANSLQRDETRVRLAWAKLLWLLTFLGVLLAVTYLVPHTVEQIQYASTRGKQRAEHDLAVTALKDQPLAQLSHASQLVSQRVVPSVVHITTETSIATVSAAGGLPGLPGGTLGPSWQMPQEIHGQGSGFIVDKQGHIVTNHHVIKGATQIEVQLSDGRRALAEVIGEDPTTDLALLKIQADNLTPIEWGPAEEPNVGSMVWAVGSPFGLQWSVTSGIISGKHRTSGITIRNKQSLESQPAYQDFLQTDAVVNPGNSGGPLVDTQGRVIGINTAIAEETYRGVVFSIPNQIAQPIIARLKEEGEIHRGWLGVELAEVAAEPVTSKASAAPKGAVVRRVIDIDKQPSPASVAGMQPGDIVRQWDGREVDDPTVLRRLVAQTKIGTRVKVIVDRGGTEVELEVAVGHRPAQL